MSLYKLRDYQEKSITLLKESFRRGLTRPVLELPTGAGKTIILAHIVASALDKGNKVLFCVPYISLISQTIRSFEAQGITSFGVIQGSHELTDSSKRLQIASVQTLSRRKIADYDLILIDEMHLQYSNFLKHIATIKTPVIGVTATAYSKGLGKHYNNLIQPITMKEMIEQGYLCSYIAYSTSKPDMTAVKISKGDYAIGESSKEMSKPQIMGDIIKTWLKLGEDSPTICFAVDVKHANYLGSEFDKINVSNRVITASTPMEEREEIFAEFKKGYIKLLINVGCLLAGFDSIVHCIIHARPTKSQIVWKQSFGRGCRVSDGKERLILLDHAGNCERLGFPEDYSIDELDNGDKAETSKAKKKEYDEPLPKACPKCAYIKPAGISLCEKCNFQPRITQNVETVDGELTQIKGKPKTEKATTQEKENFYAELVGWQTEQRWKAKPKTYTDGYISHIFKSKYKTWPNHYKNVDGVEPSESTRGYIKSRMIAYARSKKR